MAKCDPNDTIPRSCADAFSKLSEGQARIVATAEGIREQTTKTNGNVAQLFHTSAHLGTRITMLESAATEGEGRRAKWGRRIWQLTAGLLLLAAGYLLAGGKI